MLPLRYPWIWLASGWVLAAGVGIGSLWPTTELTEVGNYDKLIHVTLYFLLMTWFAGLYEARRHLQIGLGLAAFGLVLDILQIGVAGRGFSWLDVAANCIGITLAFTLARVALAGWCQRIEQILFA